MSLKLPDLGFGGFCFSCWLSLLPAAPAEENAKESYQVDFMKITVTQSIFHKMIFDCANAQAETGGFICVKNNSIVAYRLDKGIYADTGNYRPDIFGLNDLMDEWGTSKSVQYGILHTHLNEDKYLSDEDVMFINSIFMENIWLKSMYFPIVIPKTNVFVYYARHFGKSVTIEKAPLEITKA